MILTASEFKTWLTCRRGWYLRHYRELRKISDYAPLPDVGTLVHAGLEAYYDGSLSTPSDLVAGRGIKLVEQYPEFADSIYKDVELAAIMLDGYMEWLEETGADIGLSVIAPELKVSVELGPDHTLQGKIDALMKRDVDGAVLQLEHKTVSSLNDLPQWAQSNPQFLTYELMSYMRAKETGVESDGVILNMLRRVKRTARAKPPFYDRQEVRFNVDELRNHYRHLLAVADEIVAARARLDAGESHHVVCPPTVNRSHRWSCDCAPVTAMFDDGSDVEAFLSEFYQREDPLARYEEAAEEPEISFS